MRPPYDASTVGDHNLVAHIRQHLLKAPQGPLTARGMAVVLGITEARLTRLCQQQLGMSFSEFVRTERVRQAKRLLLQTSLPIQSVSQQLGYSSATGFSSQFRHYVGVSPSQFRENASFDDLLTSGGDILWGGPAPLGAGQA